MAIDCNVKTFVAWIVATVNDSSGKNLQYERIPLDWLEDGMEGTKKQFPERYISQQPPPGSDNLVTYLWNMDKVPFRISNGKCSVFKVIPDWKWIV